MSDPSNGDPAARLARQNPTVTSLVDPVQWETAKQRIFRSVVATPHRTRWWKRKSFFAAVIVVGAIGASAAGYSLTRSVTNPTLIECFAGDTLSSRAELTQLKGSPQATCAEDWRSGLLGPGTHRAFTVCVHPDGDAVVFPTDDQSICSSLGLSAAEPLNAQQSAIAQLPTLLGNAVGSVSCPTIRMVENDARSTLRRLGLRGWEITVIQPITKQWPCATFSLWAQSKTIDVSSRERAPTP